MTAVESVFKTHHQGHGDELSDLISQLARDRVTSKPLE